MEESTDSWSDDVAKKTRMVVTKIVNSLTSQSEIGSPMAAMYLLNHPDHYTDHKFERFYWKRYVNEVRSAFVVTETDMDSAAVIESVSNDVQHLPQLVSKLRVYLSRHTLIFSLVFFVKLVLNRHKPILDSVEDRSNLFEALEVLRLAEV